MGFITKIILILPIITGIFLYLLINDKIFQHDPKDFLPVKKYFGPGNSDSKEDVSIRPFNIKVSDDLIKDLKTRIELDLERLTPPVENAK